MERQGQSGPCLFCLCARQGVQKEKRVTQTRNPLISLVAGARFELATFGL